LGVGVMHMIERIELVSGEKSVTFCIAVRRAEIVGKFNTGTERVLECDRGRTKQLT
jgi:hypothetical protein